jgi:hypothetical protein
MKIIVPLEARKNEASYCQELMSCSHRYWFDVIDEGNMEPLAWKQRQARGVEPNHLSTRFPVRPLQERCKPLPVC